MAEFSLHCFYESGNAYKPALMLALNEADWEPIKVDFFNGETRGSDWRTENNVMGEVPVLTHHRQDGDLTLTQSGAILTYLARHFGSYGPSNEEQELEVMRWLLFDSQKVSGYAGPLRFLRHLKRTGETEVTAFLHGRLAGALAVLDARLEGRKWLAADGATIADLACCGYLYWPDEIGIDLADYPNISPWLEQIAALPGYQSAAALMPRAFGG
ncbi:glutathione S-transferase family protein [Notoacmeibacter ruber]|uniref:Glutathione S-transferase family protein n=2 Tax=Notoacmeibacter ruber TaxID=2670375 RepID=A0A3L7JC85_9HYPH|nr:glutathione S-transferase family protein [Notoacmeibacter ruber]RLQ87171.1 glutathione S-transferase family protein [Notoacmeibacter ruber]